MNNITPTAYMGGEPVKVYILRKFEIPMAEGLASVVIAKTLSLFYHFLGWIVNSGEVYLFFHFIDQHITLITAVTVDALATMIANTAFFIPASLGVQARSVWVNDDDL